MLESLGQADVLVLRNHGVAVCGRTSRGIHAAVDGAARGEIQCQAGMLPGPDTVLTNDVRQHCADTAARLVAADAFATKVFDATVRKMKAAKR